jgi:hypothetical protein
MNKLIKAELNKVSVANISNYDKSKGEFLIPRITKIRLEENSYYIIKLDEALLNPNEASTLSVNWNQGTLPPHKYLKVDVSKVMGKMVKVNSIAYDYENQRDLNASWSGWLPIAQIEVLEKI